MVLKEGRQPVIYVRDRFFLAPLGVVDVDSKLWDFLSKGLSGEEWEKIWGLVGDAGEEEKPLGPVIEESVSLEKAPEYIFGPRGRLIPAPPNVVFEDSDLWSKLETSRKEKEEAERLAERRIGDLCRVVNSILRGLYDQTSGGLVVKLGLFVKLTEDSDLTDEEALKLCKNDPVGQSNVYIAPKLDGARGLPRIATITPLWLYNELFQNERYNQIYKTIEGLYKKGNTGEVDKLSKLAYRDVWCMYELVVMIINFFNGEIAGVVKGQFMPSDHKKARKEAWELWEMLRNLNGRFNWPHKGQPTLKELLTATYQVLTEKKEEMSFEKEILPVPFLA